MTGSSKDQAVAVLTSGGTESAAMVAEALRRYERVYPVYIRKGFIWERMEMVYLRRFLRSVQQDSLARAEVLSVPLQPVYIPHWSLGKSRVPGWRAPDESVYLPGRNLLLLGLAGLFCSMRKVPNLWIGILKGNPFRDARTGFLHQMETVVQEAADFPVRIAAPFRELTKAQVIQRFRDLPWEKTFSCLNPVNRNHCGRCQKCAERIRGFRMAGVADPTRYAK